VLGVSRAWGGLLAHPGLTVISSVIFTSSWLAFTCKDWKVNFTNSRTPVQVSAETCPCNYNTTAQDGMQKVADESDWRKLQEKAI
jgi:hypothetical protein